MPNLTKGLKKIAMLPFQIYLDKEDNVNCCFGPTPGQLAANRLRTIKQVRIFITDNLAFFANALGRESIRGNWCYRCQLGQAQFESGKRAVMWTMEELLKVTNDIDGGKPKMAIKKKP